MNKNENVNNEFGKVKIVAFTPLSLYTELEDNLYGSLTWSIRNGYPRITTYTNNTRKKKLKFSFDHQIIAPMDAVIVNSVITNIRTCLTNPCGTSISVDCFNNGYVDGIRTDDIVLQAKIVISKDDGGVVSLMLVSGKKRMVGFNLLPNPKWHKFYDVDQKQIVDLAALSKIHTTSYCDRLQSLMDKYLDSENVFTTSKNKAIKVISDDLEKILKVFNVTKVDEF